MHLSTNSKKIEHIFSQHLLPDLKVQHTLSTPVLLIGQPRSGTSITAQMLRKYLKVNFGPESQFFIRLYHRLDQYGDLNDDANLRALIRDISRERCFRRNQFGFQVDQERIFKSLPSRTYSDVIWTIYSHFAAHNGLCRWGDKTPEYILHLPILYAMFPTAQFIHLVRDGRDVALSHFDTHFGAKNEVVASFDWRHQIALAQAFKTQLPAEQFTEFRYEDLLADPMSVFQHLIDFLQIDDADRSLARYIEKHAPRELASTNAFKWKQQFTHRQKRNYERVAREALESYHYETIFEKLKPLGRVARLYWLLHHYYHKSMKLSYWQNNLYKIVVRLRDITISIRRTWHINKR